MSRKHFTPLARPQAFFTTDESAQYFECGYSCDHAILLVLDARKIFFTDSRYTTEARENLASGVEVVESANLLDSMIELLQKERVKSLAFDPLQVCVQEYQTLLAKLPQHLEPLPNFHQQLRIIKSDEQVALIAKSQKLNKKAYKRFAKMIEKLAEKGAKEGAKGGNPTELYLHALARQALEQDGSYTLSFSPILSLNANAAKPHALPCNDRLRDGDLLLFDAGIKYKRYCSDRTRTAVFSQGRIHFGKKQKFSDKKLQHIYDIVRKAQESAITNLRAGMSGKQIDALAREVIDKAGYGEYFSHSTGHGIGLDIHELPSISKRSEMIIEDGMVFSIEPGIYLPNLYGVRIEDLVVVRNGRAEVL